MKYDGMDSYGGPIVPKRVQSHTTDSLQHSRTGSPHARHIRTAVPYCSYCHRSPNLKHREMTKAVRCHRFLGRRHQLGKLTIRSCSQTTETNLYRNRSMDPPSSGMPAVAFPVGAMLSNRPVSSNHISILAPELKEPGSHCCH